LAKSISRYPRYPLEEARIETAKYRAEKSQAKIELEAAATKILIRLLKKDFDLQAKRMIQKRKTQYQERIDNTRRAVEETPLAYDRTSGVCGNKRFSIARDD
jgi:hypothetical protein